MSRMGDNSYALHLMHRLLREGICWLRLPLSKEVVGRRGSVNRTYEESLKLN